MKRATGLLALAFSLVGARSWAQEVDASEDPFRDEERRESRDAEADDHGGYIDDEEPRTFGRAGDVVISAERLLGVARASRRIEIKGAPDDKSNATHVHALMNAGGQDFLGFSAARIGFDVFAAQGFSVGGVLGYSGISGPLDTRQFTGGLRVGYNWMFGKVLGVWGRAGLTFQDHQINVPDSDLPGAQVDAKASFLAASADAQLVVVPAKNIVILLGPRMDVSFLGKFDADGAKKTDARVLELGFAAGLGVFF